jgi:hypothetical protein
MDQCDYKDGMIDASDMVARNAALVRLLGEKYGVKALCLDQAIRRAGRRLPKRLRAQAAVLIEAERMAQVPKLVRRVDVPAVEGAEKALTAHLNAIDVKDRRMGVALGLAGTVVAQVLLVAGAFVAWLWWRGYI